MIAEDTLWRKCRRRDVAAEPRRHGGSPCIYAGEKRFSAPEQAPPIGSGLMIQPGEVKLRFSAGHFSGNSWG